MPIGVVKVPDMNKNQYQVKEDHEEFKINFYQHSLIKTVPPKNMKNRLSKVYNIRR